MRTPLNMKNSKEHEEQQGLNISGRLGAEAFEPASSNQENLGYCRTGITDLPQASQDSGLSSHFWDDSFSYNLGDIE